VELEAHGKLRYYLGGHQLSQATVRGRHEDADQAMVCSWGPQRRGYQMVEATVKVGVPSTVLDLEKDTAGMEAAGCGMGSGEMGERKLGLMWGGIEVECEAEARVVEKCDR
jgi:hypothetical protein